MNKIDIANYLSHSPHMFLDADILDSKSFSLSKLSKENYNPFSDGPNVSRMVHSVINAERTLASYIHVPSDIFQLKALIIKLIDPNLPSEEKQGAFQALDEEHRHQLIHFLPENININENPSELLNYWVDDQNIIEAYIDALQYQRSFYPTLIYQPKLASIQEGFSHLAESYYDKILLNKFTDYRGDSIEEDQEYIEAIFTQAPKYQEESSRFELAKKILKENKNYLDRICDLIDSFSVQSPEYREEIIDLVWGTPVPFTNEHPSLLYVNRLMNKWNYSPSQKKQFILDSFSQPGEVHRLNLILDYAIALSLPFEDILYLISHINIEKPSFSDKSRYYYHKALKKLISCLKLDQSSIHQLGMGLIKKNITPIESINILVGSYEFEPLIQGELALTLTIEAYCKKKSIDIPDRNTTFDKLNALLKNGYINIIRSIPDLSFFSKEQKFALIISTTISFQKRLDKWDLGILSDYDYLLNLPKFRITLVELKELLYLFLENNLYEAACIFFSAKEFNSTELLKLAQQYIDNGYSQFIPFIISRSQNSTNPIEPETKWKLAEKFMQLGYAHEVLDSIKVFELNKITDIDKRTEFFQELVNSSDPTKLPIIGQIISAVDIPSPEKHLSLAKYDFTIHEKKMLCSLERYNLSPTEQTQFFQHILREINKKMFSDQSLSQAIVLALKLIELDTDNQSDFRKKSSYLSKFIHCMDTNATKIYQQMIMKEGVIDPKLVLITMPIAIFLSKDGWDHFPTNLYDLVEIQNMICESADNLSLYMESLIGNFDVINRKCAQQNLSHILLFQQCLFTQNEQGFQVRHYAEVDRAIYSFIHDLFSLFYIPNINQFLDNTQIFLEKRLHIQTNGLVDICSTLYQLMGININVILRSIQFSLNEKKEFFTQVLDFHHSQNTSLQIDRRSELIQTLSKYGNLEISFRMLALFCSRHTSRCSELFNFLAKKPSLLMPSMLIAKIMSKIETQPYPESIHKAISHTIHRLHRELKDTNKLTTWNEFCLELNQMEKITPLKKIQLLHLAMIDQEEKNNHDLLIHIVNNFRLLLFELKSNKKAKLLQIYQSWQADPSTSIQKKLKGLLESILSNETFLELSNDEDMQKFIQIFIYAGRSSLALLSYINSHKYSSPIIQQEIKRFLQSVMDHSFKETRYETTNNPHLAKIKQEHEAIYDRWCEPVHVEPISAYLSDIHADEAKGTDWALFFKEKLEHRHWSSELFPKLAEFIALPKEEQTRLLADYQAQASSHASPADLKIMELLSLESEDVRAKLEEIEEELRKIDPTMELINDIQGQLTLLSSSSSDISQDFVIQDTDEWEDLFLSGTEVVGSCQRVDGSPRLNKALLGYVMDGKNRMIAIKNKNGNIIGRQIFRLLWNPQTNQPCLFMEVLYSVQQNKQINNIILNYAKKRAREIGCELFVVGDKPNTNGAKLESLGSCSPFEYTDAGEPKIAENGIFSISSFVQIPLE